MRVRQIGIPKTRIVSCESTYVNQFVNQHPLDRRAQLNFDLLTFPNSPTVSLSVFYLVGSRGEQKCHP